MPQSKTHSSRAKKLAKRRADQQRRAVPQTYVVMLDQLRAVLNKRFYEEQGFPHLEILAERYKGPVTTGHLSNYFELQHFFIGMGAAMANALSAERKFSMEQREDHCAAVAYAIAATILDLREDFRDVSGWAGPRALEILRSRWGQSKMAYAGITDTAKFMDDRSMACYFGMDFVMTFLDLTGELAQFGSENVFSVTTCKDEVISAFTSYLTSDPALGGSRLVDLQEIIEDNTVTAEFKSDYPNWRPESADAFNTMLVGYNALSPADTAYLEELVADPHFKHDMRALYVRAEPNDSEQGMREEIVMGYALRYGPRSKAAFAAGRDPTEEEMDQDAEVINLLVMTTFSYADPAFVPGVDDDPVGSEARGDDEGDSHVYRMTAAPQVEDVFKSWKAGVLTAGKPKDTAE